MRDVREKIRRNIVRQYNSEAKGAVRHALADYYEALFTAADAAPVADTVTIGKDDMQRIGMIVNDARLRLDNRREIDEMRRPAIESAWNVITAALAEAGPDGEKAPE